MKINIINKHKLFLTFILTRTGRPTLMTDQINRTRLDVDNVKVTRVSLSNGAFFDAHHVHLYSTCCTHTLQHSKLTPDTDLLPDHNQPTVGACFCLYFTYFAFMLLHTIRSV